MIVFFVTVYEFTTIEQIVSLLKHFKNFAAFVKDFHGQKWKAKVLTFCKKFFKAVANVIFF